MLRDAMDSSSTYDPTAKQKAQAKTARIPIKIVPAEVLSILERGGFINKWDWMR